MMQKKDLIDVVAYEAAVSPREAKKVLDALGTVAMRTLSTGGAVKLPGLGKLEPKARAARPGRNPKTGETVEIPASTTVRFAPGIELKRAVNGVPVEPSF